MKKLKNIELPRSKPIINVASFVEEYIPKTKIKCQRNTIYKERGEPLIFEYTQSKGGEFVRALVIDCRYFYIYGQFRLGHFMRALLSPYSKKKKMVNKRIRSSFLLLLWTDMLTEIDSVYPSSYGDFNIFETSKKASLEFHKITRLLLWLKTQSLDPLRRASSKELIPIFSEYVMDANAKLSTVQSNYLQVVKKYSPKKELI